jgi:Flp pilus assembly protein TadG
MFKNLFRKFSKSDTGLAGIEFAFILPLMVLLYFGLMDVTGLINFNRKITAAASITAGLVGQERNAVLKAKIQDIYNATAMVMAPTPMSNVHIDVYGFRNVSGTITQIWKTDNGQGPSCGGAPSTSTMASLMAAGNDVVVARTCYTYTPYVATFLGTNILGATSFLVKATQSDRPRSSLQLTCYNSSTFTAGNICS